MKQQLNRLPFKERSIQKIKDAMLLDNLLKYCNGVIDLTNGQLTAHLKLVGKILPDLQAVQHDVSIEHTSLSIHDLNGRLASLGHNPDDVWKSLNNNKIIDIKPEPIIQSEPINQTVDKIESDSQSD